MNIPENFKKAISDVFYDKKIDILSKKTEFDEEGDYRTESSTRIGEFDGNVSFSNFKAIKEEYGLEYEIDIAITTSLVNKEKLNIGNLISYNDFIYEITDKFERDSHLMIVGAKWE